MTDKDADASKDKAYTIQESDQLDVSFRKMKYWFLCMQRYEQLALLIRLDALPANLVNEFVPQEFMVAVMHWCLSHNKGRALFNAVVPDDQQTRLALAPGDEDKQP